MRLLIFLLLAMFQLPLFAQKAAVDANVVLDNVLAGLKADAPVRMDYIYKVYDDDNELLQGDRGIIYVDNGRYALLMQDMKVWCDGTTQWSYMREVDEVYITDADSEEAQNFSPLYIVEHYRSVCELSAASKGGLVAVNLQAKGDDNGVGSIELLVSGDDNRLVSMTMYMPGQGRIDVELDGYVADCGADSALFACPLDEFSTAEIVDMR